MKVIWLNDSLVFRAENKEEKQAIAVVFKSLETEDPANENSLNEESTLPPENITENLPDSTPISLSVA